LLSPSRGTGSRPRDKASQLGRWLPHAAVRVTATWRGSALVDQVFGKHDRLPQNRVRARQIAYEATGGDQRQHSGYGDCRLQAAARCASSFHWAFGVV